VYLGWYIPREARKEVYPRWYIPREARKEVHPGIYTTLGMPGIHHLVYTPPCTPGYTSCMSCTPSTSAPATSLPGEGALGSKEEKPPGWRPLSPLKVLKV